MNAKLFLSSSFNGRAGNGMTRAELGPGGAWRTQVVGHGYDVRCLAADPRGSGVIYAGTQGQGLLRSDDRGLSWEPSGLEDQVVKAIAVSPHDPDVVYAGTMPAYMYLSRDGGRSWRELEGFKRIPFRWLWFSPAESPWKAYVHAIAISPTDPNVILAGIEFGAVVRSEDGGRTWSGHRKGAIRDCHSMTFHARSGDWVYEAGASFGAGAVSRDGGRRWRQIRKGLDRRYGWACAADPGKPEVWYISASTGPNKAHSWNDARAAIFRASGGSGWEKLSGGLPDPLNSLPATLLTDPAAPGHIYAGLSNGEVWFSQDYGDAWSRLAVDLKGIWHQLLMLP